MITKYLFEFFFKLFFFRYLRKLWTSSRCNVHESKGEPCNINRDVRVLWGVSSYGKYLLAVRHPHPHPKGVFILFLNFFQRFLSILQSGTHRLFYDLCIVLSQHPSLAKRQKYGNCKTRFVHCTGFNDTPG